METATQERPPGRFRLLRYYSIASFIALVLAVLGLAFFFRQIAIKQVIKFGEDTNVHLARAFANSLRQHYIPLISAAENLSADKLSASPAFASVHKAVMEAVRDTHVVKVKIYDPKGRTVYSSDLRHVGEDKSTGPGFSAARAGGVKTVLYSDHALDAFGTALSGREVLGSYVPVRRPGSDDIDAVFEVYGDVTPFIEEISRTQRNMRLSTATVIILLYAVLFLIVKRADDVIKRQEKQREQDAETIRYLAHHDALTDLPNRTLFADRLTTTLARAKRSGHMAALMFIDFDHFKQVNDTLGHAAGDRVLRVAGERLRNLLRQSDTVARLGGDEFTIILEDIAAPNDPETVAEKIRTAFSTPVLNESGTDIVITPSIGIALYPLHAEDIDALLKAADTAMYDAKAAGRNAYRFFRPAPDIPDAIRRP